MSDFVHLHVHTEYSLLDGLSKINKLVDRAAELEMPALAITDHGTMFGVIDFFRACRKRDIKPLIGVEAYLAQRGMTDRDPTLDRERYHLLLLAQNMIGYRNLLQISSMAQLEGFYYRPRTDKDFLAAHSEGLICTTGCLAAEVPRLLMRGETEKAKQQLGWYQDVFGPDRFFIELQDHDIPELAQVNQALMDIAPYANIPFVATNDVHYVRREDAHAHDVLLCIQTGTVVSEPNRMRMSDASYYLRTAAEMEKIFGHIPGALENSLRIAEMCDVELDDNEYHLPVFADLPPGKDAQGYLRQLCEEGIRLRYGSHADDPAVQERLDYELGIIHEMGFDTYFLIVWDLCDFAKKNDIWWNVRGSGAGSIVAYALEITVLDPLSNNLIFERFLNPARVSMPDIDLDYPDDQRARMIEYTVNKYGQQQVAQIITFGTMGARAAIRDVGRALDIPLPEVNNVASMVPAVPGKPVGLAQALAEVPDLKKVYNSSDYIRELLDTAQLLEGVARHASTHAAGVIVADKPLIEYTPLHRPTSNADGALGQVTQFPMEILESIGLLKVDFLGLSTLTIMRKACELIEQNHGVRYDLNTIPYRPDENDPEQSKLVEGIFDLMSEGNVAAVFQVEGSGLRRTLMEMRPRKFEHVIAAISLFRPGPMQYIPDYIKRMHGEQEVTYKHERLQPILEETYGIAVYQEQVVQIATAIGGYTAGEGDLMRRAVSKKKKKEIDYHRGKFINGAVEGGIDKSIAASIYDDLEEFARYGFNKSHAADYAIITCQTAFLKAHYPVEYMAAVLSVERNNTDKVGYYIADCRRQSIEVLPPSVNTSSYDFTIEQSGDSRDIRFGLSAVKNVGDGPVETIIAARDEGGPFLDLADFCRRVDLRQVGRRALESLAKVGALDIFGQRLQVYGAVERMLNYSAGIHKAADIGQMSLFGEATGVSAGDEAGQLLADGDDVGDITERETLNWERELLGVYVSSHPMHAVMHMFNDVVTMYSTEATEGDHGRSVRMAGVVTYVRPHVTKNNKAMAFAGIEDIRGTFEVVIWPSTWEKTRTLWEPDKILLLSGKLDAKDGEAKLLCDNATDNFEVIKAADSPDLAPPEWMSEPAPPVGNGKQDAPPTNGNAQQSNGSHTNEEDAAYWPPPASDVVSGSFEPLPPTRAAGDEDENEDDENGDDESYEFEDSVAEIDPPAPPQPIEPPTANAQASDAPAPQDDAPTPPDTAHIAESTPAYVTQAPPAPLQDTFKVTITLQRTGDPELDKRIVRMAHNILIRYPGSDPFCLRLAGNGKLIEVDFPNDTTGYGYQLVDDLATQLGQYLVDIDPPLDA